MFYVRRRRTPALYYTTLGRNLTSRDSAARQQWRLSANRASRKPLLSERPILLWSRSHLRAFVRIMTLMYLASDELTPAAESALVYRLLEDGDNPNAWTMLAAWASDDAYAVVLECDGGVAG